MVLPRTLTMVCAVAVRSLYFTKQVQIPWSRHDRLFILSLCEGFILFLCVLSTVSGGIHSLEIFLEMLDPSTSQSRVRDSPRRAVGGGLRVTKTESEESSRVNSKNLHCTHKVPVEPSLIDTKCNSILHHTVADTFLTPTTMGLIHQNLPWNFLTSVPFKTFKSCNILQLYNGTI